jgi:hypothetical protein
MAAPRALPFTLIGLAVVLVAALIWHWPVGYSPVKHQQTTPISVGVPAPDMAVPAVPARPAPAVPAQPASNAPAPAPPAATQGPAAAPAGTSASQGAGSSPAEGYPGGGARGPCQNPTTLAEIQACGGG